MTDQVRRREDYKSGTITDNPLAFGDTVFHSAELVAVMEIAGDDHMVLTLDPLGAELGPETVWLVDHAAGSDTGTIDRGREGTTAVEHPLGTGWAAGWGFSDGLVQVVDDAELPAGTGLPFVGMVADVHNDGRLVRWDGTQWVPLLSYNAAGRVGATLLCDNNQLIPNIVETLINWNNSVFDPLGFQTSGAQITVPVGYGGLYAVTASVRHAANAGNEFGLAISSPDLLPDGVWKTGPQKGTTPYSDREGLGITVPLADGDRIVVGVTQSTGGATAYNGRLDAYRIGG